MEVKQLEINKVTPYARNPRHNAAAIDKVAASLKEFGWQQPIVVDKDYIIIVGHTRLLAAQKLNLKKVPVLVADNLTEAQVKAYRIADNKVGEIADWDAEMLSLELEDLANLDYDLEMTGFDENELAELNATDDEEDKEQGLTDEDAVPDVPENYVTKEGDVWICGDHRLMCGDSTNENHVAKLVSYFEGKKKHCISDPPYGIAYKPDTKKYTMIKNDDTFLDYVSLAKKYTDGFFVMWTGYQVQDEWTKRIKVEFEKLNNIIIWHKGGGGMGDCMKTLAQDYEIALVVNRGNNIQASRKGAVWDFQKERMKEFIKKSKKEELVEVLNHIADGEVVWQVKKDNTSSYLHPTQKPVELNQKMLENFTKKGEAVIDLFLGSGGNMIACQTMKRKCGGMELDPRYCDVIVQRWQEFTGEDAYREKDNARFNDLLDEVLKETEDNKPTEDNE